jgi:non-heme chloroperoxidase
MKNERRLSFPGAPGYSPARWKARSYSHAVGQIISIVLTSEVIVTAIHNRYSHGELMKKIIPTRRNFIGSAAAIAVGSLALSSLARGQTTNSPVARATGNIKTKDGTQLYIKDWGQGRPVIMLAAWPLSADCWDYHAHVLTGAGYRAIAYDRRGFGRSSQPSDGYNYDTFADDLAAVIEATDASDITLAGYSMGGGEVVRYLSRHSARKIRQVALVASIAPGIAKTKLNPDGVDRTFFDGLKGSVHKDKAGFLAGLLKDVFYDISIAGTTPVTQATVDWSWQMAMQAGLRGLVGCIDAFGGADFRPELSAINLPTLILHGTADKPVPFALTARQAAAGIKNSKLVAYQGAAHGILASERDRVAQDLLAFLRS